MIGFTAGGSLLEHPPFAGVEAEVLDTPYGSTAVYRDAGWCLILRHGARGDIPPHRVNHRAHIDCLHRLGCERVVAFCSVGSLRPDLPPGMLVVPHDFINHAPVLTFYDEDPRHVTPVLSDDLRAMLGRVLRAAGEDYVEGGVYYQTIGPRLETRAEVRMIAQFADVVGMTFGHEATLCNEAGLEVAALCSVDNFGHGLGGGAPLRAADISRAKRRRTAHFVAVATELIAMESNR